MMMMMTMTTIRLKADGCYFIFRGTFRMERPDGSTFDVRIPPFSLESKEEEPLIVS